MKNVRFFLLLLAALLAAVGCGGGSGSRGGSSRGKASVRIVWPVPSRAIPGNANQIVVKFYQGTTIPNGATPFQTLPTITKPSDAVLNAGGGVSIVSIDLPPGNFIVQAAASNSTDGKALAQGASPITILAGKDTPFVVTMDTTLARYLITDTGTNVDNTDHALSPAVFFIDVQGAYTLEGATKKYTTPAYNSTHPTTNVQITPQSASSDLLLLPTSTGVSGPRIELHVDGGGLSAPVNVPTVSTSSDYATTLTYGASSDPASTFRLDYYDYVYSDPGNTGSGSFTASLLSSLSTSISIGSTASTGFKVTVAGLPADFTTHPENYRLLATLYENNLGGEFGTTYAGQQIGQTSQVSFGDVTDRGRGFTIDVTLQLKTEGSGFVDYAYLNGSSLFDPGTPLSGVPTATIPDADSTGSDPSKPHNKRIDGFSPVVVASQSFSLKRGDGTTAGTFVNVTGIKVGIQTGTSGGNPLYASAVLDADLFSHDPPAPGTRIINGLTGDQALIQTTAGYWVIAAFAATSSGQTVSTSFDATFLGKRPTAAAPTGTIGVAVSPNGGHIGVGVG